MRTFGLDRDGAVEPGQRVRQLRLQSRGEGSRVRVPAELAVIFRAPLLEIPRQVLIGVPVVFRTSHPDLLAPQSLAQRRQHADFVVDAVDLGIPLAVLLQHEIAPFRRDDVLDGNTFVQAHDAAAILVEALQPADRLDHRPVHRVVRMERQGGQHRGQHPPVMPGIGGAQHGMHLALERARRLVLADDRRQRVQAGHREHDIPHRAVRIGRCRLCDPHQYPLLALDLVHFLRDPFDHGVPCLAGDPVNGLDQQIDEPVRDLPLAVREKQRINRMPPPSRMPPHPPWRLIGHAPAE